MDVIDRCLDALKDREALSPRALERVKKAASAGGGAFPGNAEILKRYHRDVLDGKRARNEAIERSLVLNKVRSDSGVVTITVMTKPYRCPGRCVYCPTEERAPKSYLPSEPPVLRALHTDYDPYGQFLYRLKALKKTGHGSEKIELIIKGGTWSAYPRDYQETFIQRCLDAANGELSVSIGEAQLANETATHRIIGVTVETRPDCVTPEEARRLRRLGVTRVELGVQSLDDRVLKECLRDHDTARVRSATRLLKDAGFKVAYHMMPNLPGADPEGDLKSLRTLFEDPDFRPDGLKIYPCVVVESAPLYSIWKKGEYRAYSDAELVSLIAAAKKDVPPYTRLERVIRDVPAPMVRDGCSSSNLRERILGELRAMGARCRCIRCRQIRDRGAEEFVMRSLELEASGAKEFFLSFEDRTGGRLAAFLRLRINSGRADVRELHTYGRQLPIGEKAPARPEASGQNRGLGRRLLAKAEEIAFSRFQLGKLRVISGVGARPYYRKLGYSLEDTYMVKRRPS